MTFAVLACGAGVSKSSGLTSSFAASVTCVSPHIVYLSKLRLMQVAEIGTAPPLTRYSKNIAGATGQ
jgi:hypothetical protein